MKDFTPTSYTLECVATGREFEDTGWMLADPQYKTPSLIRAKYARRQLDVKPAEWGLYRFCDWLPVRRILKGSSAPVTYKSKGLAAHLGLENLWITFNGYYPAIGATMSTCSFKETEAYSVCGRAAEHEDRVLVVASAGNTARAFAKVCSDNNIKLLLSVPYDNIDALWFDESAEPLRETHLVCDGRRLFRRHPPERPRPQGPGFLRRRRREEHRPPRRHGHDGTFGRDDHRPHPRLLFPGRGQRYGRHCRLGRPTCA